MPPLLGPAGHRHTANVPSENIFNTSNVPSENIFNTANVPSENIQPRVSTLSQPLHTKSLALKLDQHKPIRLNKLSLDKLISCVPQLFKWAGIE